MREERGKWRKSGDPATPGFKLSEPHAKTRAPHDPTYGAEPDLLDAPGLIVEPDVRRKISKYFKQMKLRNETRKIQQELDELLKIEIG